MAVFDSFWQKGSLRVIWAEVPMRLNQAPETDHIQQLTSYGGTHGYLH